MTDRVRPAFILSIAGSNPIYCSHLPQRQSATWPTHFLLLRDVRNEVSINSRPQRVGTTGQKIISIPFKFPLIRVPSEWGRGLEEPLDWIAWPNTII
ncbi:MAG: hypothetical protein GDA38_22425 [Hormoscilla sp. SP12CHS1]|nr:hypothetical protein [Hormoscilla sp. SP12CHS1]